MKSAVHALIAIVAFLGAGCAGCSFKEEPQESDELIATKEFLSACTVELEAGHYESARNYAARVINDSRYGSLDHLAVDQARFCYTTANTLHNVNELTKQLQTLLDVLLGLTGGTVSFGSPEGMRALREAIRDGRLDPQAQSAIGVMLSAFTGRIKATLEENTEQLGYIIDRGRFRWSLIHLPVKIGDAEIMDAGGLYDMGEIHLLYGVTRALLSTLYVIEAQDYTVSAASLVDYFMLENTPLSAVTSSPGTAIANAYAVIMGTSPLFLSLDKTAGRELMQMAGEGYAAGFDSFLDAIKVMKDRRDDQSKHLVEYLEKDKEMFLVFHAALNNGANPLPFFDITKFNGFAVPVAPEILDSAGRIRDDIAGVSGINTNLQRDIFPMIAMGTVVLIGSGALDALINMALESSDPDTKKIADKILAVIRENQDIVLGALVALVPVQIELDLGHLFDAPQNLRDSLPAWTQPETLDDMAGFVTATAVYSYECDEGGDPLRAGTFLCASASSSSDQGHFRITDDSPYYVFNGTTEVDSGLTWTNHPSQNFGPMWNSQAPIAADGIGTVAPYLGFKDPTLGGVLYLDIAAIENPQLQAAKSGFEPATLRTLNATIASAVATVQGFLGE